MWSLGKLKDTSLSKLKELAADVVAPRYEDDPDLHIRRRKKDDDEDEVPARAVHGRSTPTASNEPTPVRPVRSEAPRSVPPTPGGNAVSDVSVGVLRERIRVLEAENADIRAQTNQYALEVRRAHEETVAYYSQQIAERDKSIQQLQQQLNTMAQQRASQQDSAMPEATEKSPAHEDLVAKCAALEKQLRAAAEAHEAVLSSALSKERNLQQQEVAALKEQLRVVKTDADEQIRRHGSSAASAMQREEALRKELEGLREANGQLQESLQHAASEVSRLRAQGLEPSMPSNLQEQIDELSSKLDAAERARAEDARTHLLTVEGVRAQAQLEQTRLLNEIDRLQQKVEQVESLRAEQAATTSSENDTHGSANNASSRIETLEASLHATNEAIQQRDAVIADLQRTLATEQTRFLEAQKNLAQGHEERLRTLRRELESEFEVKMARAQEEEAQRRAAASKLDEDGRIAAVRQELEQQTTLVAALKQALSDQAATYETAAQRREAELEQLARMHKESADAANQLSGEVQSLRRSLEVEKSKAEHDRTNIAALTNIKTDLEAECHRHRDLSQQLHRTCIDALAKSSVQLPNKSPTFSDCVVLLCAELQRYAGAIRDAQNVQQQWEHTYEQAREVNSSLNAQLQEAWKNIGDLREELSIKEQNVAKLAQQVKTESTRWQELHIGMSSTSSDLMKLQEEKKALQEEIARVRSSLREAEEALQSAAAEADGLRHQLDDRDEEVTTARQSVENLQHVLEAFQRGKEEEIQQQCSYLQHEVDSMKERMSSLESLREAHAEEMATLERKYRKELAGKNGLISSMQVKQQELRRMLEDAATQLQDEHMIDKRVVSHLLVNYVHSVAGERGDEDDIVKVMSGLLNWDGEMQERAGLIPGPLNPKRKIATSTRALVGGLVKTLWGNPGRHIAAASSTTTDGASEGDDPNNAKVGPRSVAEMWVDFLIKEGESARRQSEQGHTAD